MRKMKCKMPQGQVRPTHHSAKQSDQRSAAGFTPAHPGSAEREIIVSRIRRLSAWVMAISAAAQLAPAAGQNLDAGKSASQIFAEVCANCHRSARELRSNAGASFLREHYTTGSEMASTMAAYLSAAGGDSRGAAQPKRQPNPAGTNPAGTPTREAPAADTSRDPRRAQQADPKTLPVPPGTTRGRPASSARAEAEAKPLASPPPAPARPALEEFEE
jgi:mono/diheme cytochrome c family protein